MEQSKVYTLDQVQDVAQELGTLLKQNAVMTLTGPLGAGKTTLVRSLLRACGVTEPITSPTFTYLNLYENQSGQTFYHFDCYRIDTVDGFVAAGFNEYLYQPNSYALIEWPELVMPLLTHDVCHVQLDYHEDADKRIIRYTCG